MKLVTVKNSSGDVVAIFTAAKGKQAASAAEMIGGSVAEYPAGLNEFKSDAGKLPRGVKAFYAVNLFKSGEVQGVRAMPLLTPAGRLQVSSWAVDSYAKRADGADKSQAVRKAYWLLCVQCYGPDEETAVTIAKEFLAEILAGKREQSGSI